MSEWREAIADMLREGAAWAADQRGRDWVDAAEACRRGLAAVERGDTRAAVGALVELGHNGREPEVMSHLREIGRLRAEPIIQRRRRIEARAKKRRKMEPEVVAAHVELLRWSKYNGERGAVTRAVADVAAMTGLSEDHINRIRGQVKRLRKWQQGLIGTH
jgi:hypothetical protein